ncbi:MAG: addiction module antidote protein, HigA family [Verrucomicrobia bacterium]|nr:MAG: addiction module antidote protein, HigA family [Verrucomicrobiota bacterium]
MYQKVPAIHPGQILWHDYLECSDQALSNLTDESGLPADEVRDIVRGERPVTPSLARHLEDLFHTSSSFWLAIQADFDRLARAS